MGQQGDTGIFRRVSRADLAATVGGSVVHQNHFKIREGLPIGCKVTLRRTRMYEFLDRLVTIAMPRIRDFRGLPASKGFDGRGNFAFGLKEQIVFPEIDYDKVDSMRGMDIIFVTTAKTNKEAKALLKAFDLPFVG